MPNLNPKSSRPVISEQAGSRPGLQYLAGQIPNSLIKIISTFFFVGYLPFFPGTFASVVGIFLFYLVKNNMLIYLSLSLGLLILGFWVSGKAERLFGKKDAPCIVIDEVAGIFLCFLFIPYDTKLMLIGFVLFRIFDALKVFPAARLQEQRGSIGVMTDDIIAAIYTNILLQIVFRFTSLRIS